LVRSNRSDSCNIARRPASFLDSVLRQPYDQRKDASALNPAQPYAMLEKVVLMGVTLLHFANLRLGSGFTTFGVRGRDQRAQLLVTLASIGDIAITERVDAVLISGDLFACAVPAPQTIKAVQVFSSRLLEAGIPLVIVAGTRDAEGIFDRGRQPDSADVCPGAIHLGTEVPVASLESAPLDVHSVELPIGKTGTVEVKSPVVARSGRIAIGLGYWRNAGEPDLAELASVSAGFGIAYLGVGGSVQFSVSGARRPIVCSPGVPEPLDWGQEHGTIAIVAIDDSGKVVVARRDTGTRAFARCELEVSSDSAGTVRDIIGRLANDDLGLEAVLTGTCPAEILIDPGTLEGELGDNFFNLRVVDRTGLVIDTSGVGSLPQGTVLGNFARVMDTRIRSARDEDEAALDREAYRLGLNLLQGDAAL
jgi:hypothetical protein